MSSKNIVPLKNIFLYLVWVAFAIWLSIRFEDVYLGWFGTSVAYDEDHIFRFFVLGFLRMCGQDLANRRNNPRRPGIHRELGTISH
jgi:hypothetical protein